MKDIIDKIKAAKRVMDEVESVYNRLEGREPQPWQVALPLLYQRADAQRWTDQKTLDFIGLYLYKQYPELSEYFISEERKRMLATLKSDLDECFGGRQ